eukprot:6532220-Prymnesium_polylepis.1
MYQLLTGEHGRKPGVAYRLMRALRVSRPKADQPMKRKLKELSPEARELVQALSMRKPALRPSSTAAMGYAFWQL